MAKEQIKNQRAEVEKKAAADKQWDIIEYASEKGVSSDEASREISERRRHEEMLEIQKKQIEIAKEQAVTSRMLVLATIILATVAIINIIIQSTNTSFIPLRWTLLVVALTVAVSFGLAMKKIAFKQNGKK